MKSHSTKSDSSDFAPLVRHTIKLHPEDLNLPPLREDLIPKLVEMMAKTLKEQNSANKSVDTSLEIGCSLKVGPGPGHPPLGQGGKTPGLGCEFLGDSGGWGQP